MKTKKILFTLCLTGLLAGSNCLAMKKFLKITKLSTIQGRPFNTLFKRELERTQGYQKAPEYFEKKIGEEKIRIFEKATWKTRQTSLWLSGLSGLFSCNMYCDNPVIALIYGLTAGLITHNVIKKPIFDITKNNLTEESMRVILEEADNWNTENDDDF